MNPIRNSIKAIIIANGSILLTKNSDPQGIFYLLPGGGQEPGETMIDALQRECREELGVDVIAHDLEIIREYMGKNHEFAEWDGEAHQIEFMFRCSIAESSSFAPSNPDTAQIGVEWVPIRDLPQHRVYPKALRAVIQEQPLSAPTVYLGDVN